MLWRSSIQTMLWPFLSGLLFASCGDVHDPASGSQGTILSHPSLAQAPQQPIGGNDSQLTPPASGDAVDPASLPITTDTAPASTETTGTGPQRDTLANGSAAEQVTPPPLSGTTQLSTGGGDNMPPWLSRDGLQPEPVRSENRPPTRSVTFTWNPSSSGNANGYRVYVTAVSTLVQHAIDAGPEPRLTVDLPIGERYDLTVTAYNADGESPPASPIQFDLF